MGSAGCVRAGAGVMGIATALARPRNDGLKRGMAKTGLSFYVG